MSYKGGQYLHLFSPWLGWYWSSLQGLCICKAGVIPFSFFFAILTFNLAGTKNQVLATTKRLDLAFRFISASYDPLGASLCARLCCLEMGDCARPRFVCRFFFLPPSSSRWNLPDSSAALLYPHRRYRQIKCHHGFVLHALSVGPMHCRPENLMTRTWSETWCGTDWNPYLILKSDNYIWFSLTCIITLFFSSWLNMILTCVYEFPYFYFLLNKKIPYVALEKLGCIPAFLLVRQ